MKYKTYKRLTHSIVEMMKSESKWNERLQNAIGGDTYVSTEIFNEDISAMINAINDDMGDAKSDNSETWTEYLIYDILLSGNDKLTFETGGREYKANTKNIYKVIKGKI